MQTVLFNKENFRAINQPEVSFHVSESAARLQVNSCDSGSYSSLSCSTLRGAFQLDIIAKYLRASESTLLKSKMHKMLNTCSCRIT